MTASKPKSSSKSHNAVFKEASGNRGAAQKPPHITLRINDDPDAPLGKKHGVPFEEVKGSVVKKRAAVIEKREKAQKKAADLVRYGNNPKLLPAAGSAAITTAATFGLAPALTVLAKGVFDGLGHGDIKVGASDLSTVLANVVSGTYIGLTHGPTGASLGAAVLDALGGAQSKDITSGKMVQEAHKFRDVSLPLFAAFLATKTAGSALATLPPSKIADNPFFKAFVSGLGSTVAAAVFGASSQAIKNKLSPSTYKTVQPPEAGTTKASRNAKKPSGVIDTVEKKLAPFTKPFSAQLKSKNTGQFRAALAKTAAGTFGNNMATQAAAAVSGLLSQTDIANNKTAKAAISTSTNMVVFLLAWIAALHFISLMSSGNSQASSDDDRSGDNRSGISPDDPFVQLVEQLHASGNSAIEDAPERAGAPGNSAGSFASDLATVNDKLRVIAKKSRT